MASTSSIIATASSIESARGGVERARVEDGFRIHAESTLRRSAVNWSVALRLEHRLLPGQVFRTYDECVKQIPCVCGYAVKGEDDDELWQNAQAHMREDHPDLVGKVSRADLLAQAEEVPNPTS
jgi:predicted small metal-binding protein